MTTQGLAIHDPLQFVSGDTWEIAFDCTDVDDTPLDLTGASIQWKLVTPDDTQTLLICTQNDAIAILQPPTAGQCMLVLPPASSGTVPAGYFLDQLRVTTSTGRVTTQTSGRIQVLQPL